MVRILSLLLAFLTAGVASVSVSAAPQAGRRLLVASVTKIGIVALTDVSGRMVTRIPPGKYAIRVADASHSANFHLVSPAAGINKRTGVRFVGKVTWKLTLARASYVYFSDRRRHAKIHFRVG
jgi:hypothetical protein